MKTVKFSFAIAMLLAAVLFTGCKEDKEDEPIPEPDNRPTITDIEGNVYHTVTIGTQTWMVENLRTAKYNDGTAIPNVTSATSWAALTTGAWCDYDNSPTNGAKYGHLYNWFAVNTGKLAPAGWHVPSVTEWNTLQNYVATNFGSSGKPLATTTEWTESSDWNTVGNNISSNNSTGFNGQPGGYRNLNGSFGDIYSGGAWWTSVEYDINTARYRGMPFNLSSLYSYQYEKQDGMSVRCVKD